MNAPIHTAATLVVLSRWDRDCAGMQIERARVTNWSAITTMLVDFLANPQSQGLRPVLAARARRRRGGDAGGRGAEAGGGDRPALRRRLRPVGNHGAVAHQPAAPPEAAMRRHPVLQHRCAGAGCGFAERTAAERGRRDRGARPAGVPGLLEAAGGERAGLHRARRQALLPHRRPGLLRRGGLLLHHRSAEAHDQLLGLQGVAGGGRGDAVCAPGDPGSLRHRLARRLPRRDREGGGGAEKRGRETSRRKTSSIGRANGWRRSRCRAWWSSSTSCPRPRPARYSGASCRKRKTGK